MIIVLGWREHVNERAGSYLRHLNSAPSEHDRSCKQRGLEGRRNIMTQMHSQAQIRSLEGGEIIGDGWIA